MVAGSFGKDKSVNILILLCICFNSLKFDYSIAHQAGLEKLTESGPAVKGGHPVNKVASVVSFFVSRVDMAVDRELEAIGNSELAGKIAVANSKLAYVRIQKHHSAAPLAGIG